MCKRIFVTYKCRHKELRPGNPIQTCEQALSQSSPYFSCPDMKDSYRKTEKAQGKGWQWSLGKCTTDANLGTVLSRITNPPASATATYTPTKFCSEFLRQTDWETQYTTTSLASTYSNWTITHLFVTQTDYDHPTSTRLCPIPSPSMECGLGNPNIIAPADQEEDWSIEHYYNPTECQQVCLEHPLCKAYYITGSEQEGWHCEIFNKGLGPNGSNVISASTGGSKQWWDRNCQEHKPTQCIAGAAKTGTPAKTTAKTKSSKKPKPTMTKRGALAHPAITPAPVLVPRAGEAHMAKRDATLPGYLSELVPNNWWSYVYVTPACSCLITSALPPVPSTTTRTVTSWTTTTTVYETYEDWFTVTETPRQTTVFVSVN
ncbi:hypothetical protein P154DRAFT_582865 [Amniculicola lignicola CBS 123094]|uniref:Apple domain-containing protein n=1 Tax=Amniculicola lignicola CBS 123094 TaxID=1392246 RepID=A0A6A5VVH0_9PLEO|nr:hypothetical protein P154DRAFT_582865 [Amniculicola lignicola CBS 123094]